MRVLEFRCSPVGRLCIPSAAYRIVAFPLLTRRLRPLKVARQFPSAHPSGGASAAAALFVFAIDTWHEKPTDWVSLFSSAAAFCSSTSAKTRPSSSSHPTSMILFNARQPCAGNSLPTLIQNQVKRIATRRKKTEKRWRVLRLHRHQQRGGCDIWGGGAVWRATRCNIHPQSRQGGLESFVGNNNPPCHRTRDYLTSASPRERKREEDDSDGGRVEVALLLSFPRHMGPSSSVCLSDQLQSSHRSSRNKRSVKSDP